MPRGHVAIQHFERRRMDPEKSGKMKILIERLDQVDLDDDEKRMFKIQDVTVVVFPSLKSAARMVFSFVYYDLIPRVGSKEEAAKFPLIKTGPSRDGGDMLSEELGLKERPVDEEIWLLIDNSRFPEFYDYLTKKYPGTNSDIEIKDLR